ncbi:hypothetical protein HMPREF1544_09624 [Mucor circinelloides 1006PhL]|uniref:Uncharacterized protein n=1 Tax=Mucor circinelloides f. circinelloides (strain 1006PhL) TaxID=1220926 RepID=S2JM54_MUCC1|nr:hypothetical protein HMPREF1544_09624 [Mucor circinelloides 1006PhL]
MDVSGALTDNTHVIRVPEYFYAVDINYLTHMIGGISTQEINALELEFLSLIDWHLASTGPILQQYYANLVEQHPCYERILSDHQLISQRNSGPISNSKKRRRSSAEEQQQTTNLSLSEDDVDDDDDEDDDEDSQDPENARKNSLDISIKIEEETTKKHFDTLLNDETIPYIA